MTADSNKKNTPQHPDCYQCQHFYVTWQAEHPKGCKAFGFKTSLMPAMAVFDASGQPCHCFIAKTASPPQQSSTSGWKA